MSTITSISHLRVIHGAVVALFLVAGCASGLAPEDDPAAQPTDEASTDQQLLTMPVNLGTAGKFAILSQSGISTVPPSAITGDLGVSPIASTAITGFSLTMDSSNVFSTSPQVTGKVYAADYASPTPANLTTAIGDMQTAFTDAAGRPANVNELGGGNIGGLVLSPGVYKWGTSVIIPSDVSLAGLPTDVWIFEIAQNLTMSNSARVVLFGAVPKNVFWQVSGGVTLGSKTHLAGTVLAKTAITLGSTASVKGRLLSQTAVTLITNKIVRPGQ
jgi:ice-binding like protein